METTPPTNDNLRPEEKPPSKWRNLLWGFYAIPLLFILLSFSVPTNEVFDDLEEARVKYHLPEALGTFPAVGVVEGDLVKEGKNLNGDNCKFYRLFGWCASQEELEAWFAKNCGKGKPFIGYGQLTTGDQMQIRLYSRSCEMEIIVNEVSKKKARFMLECRLGNCSEELKAILDSLDGSVE